ncbi:hypothetical protein [Chitinophaga solisilvae]|uniref:hypothetical protein n=1 Tax=Chitinophaga solisilvae TaxID=1233460 RepID=UPI00136FB008|nr:hypothetical protein [Chitinophaga solisilvae]
MTIFRTYILPRYIAAILLPVLLVTACTKESEKLPWSLITSFQLADAGGNPLQAAITANEIIIYWPFGQPMPAEMTPVITVSEKAVVSPATGIKVPLKSGTNYAVTAENGNSTAYKVRIVSSQPYPVINTPDMGYQFITPGIPTNLSALYVIPDPAQTHISLISAAGKKIPMAIDSITRERIYYKYPAPIDSGRYTLMLETGIYTINRKSDLYVRNTEPALEDYGQLRVKRGDTFTLKAQGLGVITEALLILNAQGETQRIEVIGNTQTAVTLKIPAAIPAATYAYGIVLNDRYYAYENYIGLEQPVTVTP